MKRKKNEEKGTCKIITHRTIQIHVTLIRSKTVGEERSSFDASEILTNLGNFDFGTAKIDRFELSDRSQFAENGYWKSLSTIKLP